MMRVVSGFDLRRHNKGRYSSLEAGSRSMEAARTVGWVGPPPRSFVRTDIAGDSGSRDESLCYGLGPEADPMARVSRTS